MLVKVEIINVEWMGFFPDALLLIKPSGMSGQKLGFTIDGDTGELIENQLISPENAILDIDFALVMADIIAKLEGEALRIELWQDLRGTIWSYIVIRDFEGKEHRVKNLPAVSILLALRMGKGIFMEGELFEAMVEEGLPKPDLTKKFPNTRRDKLLDELLSDMPDDEGEDDDEGPKYNN